MRGDSFDCGGMGVAGWVPKVETESGSNTREIERMRRQLISWAKMLGLAVLSPLAMVGITHAEYESAEYEVIESDGAIEIREYPSLMLVATDSKMDAQGRDGSFMRLFRYISGNNAAEQKIAMTTPVFMEGEIGKADVSMGFVMPKEVAEEGAPDPRGEGVKLRERQGGRFAVIRFPGRLSTQLAKEQEAQLREWMKKRGLEGEEAVEAAGYDPPYTPARLRRNEILIRLKSTNQATADATDTATDS